MVQNSNGSGNAQLPQLSPGQYSIESEYNQNLNGSSSIVRSTNRKRYGAMGHIQAG